jgi:hypothetical protein
MKQLAKHSPAQRAGSLALSVCLAFVTLWAQAACACGAGCGHGTETSLAAEGEGCTCCGPKACHANAAEPLVAPASCCSSKAEPVQEVTTASCCSSHTTHGGSSTSMGGAACCCTSSSAPGTPVFPGREQPQVQSGKRATDELPVVVIAILPHLLPMASAIAPAMAADNSPPRAAPNAASLCTFRC